MNISFSFPHFGVEEVKPGTLHGVEEVRPGTLH